MRMFTFRAGELVHSHITMIVDLDSVSAIMEIRAVKTTCEVRFTSGDSVGVTKLGV